MNFFTYSIRNQNLKTPSNLYNYFINELGLLDFNPYNPNYEKNSLLLDYNNYYCNPPFNNIEPFVDYHINNVKNGFNSILLLPIRLNTNWFMKLLNFGADFYIIGRIKYNDLGYAPFDSMLVDITGCSSRMCFAKKFNGLNKHKFIQVSMFDLGV